MSRRSQAFATGPQKFSWQLSSFEDGDGRVRVMCESRNYPGIKGIGEDEQHAIRAAQVAIATAAEKAGI